MKKIGLVGGTGPESTLMYYKELNSRIDKMTGGSEVIALTAATMHIVYEQIVQKTNVPLVSIPKSVCEEIQKKGYKKVGIVKESTLKEFTAIIEKMKNERGIQALILGCTELPLLLNKNNCPVDCLDSVEIHLQKLIELARD